MKTWIICISGYTQKRGVSSGTVELWHLMRQYSAPEVCVQLKLWNDDFEDYAAFIRRNSDRDARILVCAYSWGAGHGFLRLAKALQGHCKIDCAVLCDPIYRSRLLSMRWLAFSPWPKITIPTNVQDVYWFRQEVDRPRSHDLRASDDEMTWIHPAEVLPLPHTEIDNSPVYHERCLAEASRLVHREYYETEF